MPKGVIVVTGVTPGIGAAIARARASDKWQIAGLSPVGYLTDETIYLDGGHGMNL
jgi:NAD(P)-dependent dehydrogenase (short-subunit alcohol dehydrogenase family)